MTATRGDPMTLTITDTSPDALRRASQPLERGITGKDASAELADPEAAGS
jgi:hypothetical protein